MSPPRCSRDATRLDALDEKELLAGVQGSIRAWAMRECRGGGGMVADMTPRERELIEWLKYLEKRFGVRT